ncbi:hypothetical protein [Marixanthomonas spongiae]|uniref:Uncharacterized protein n=1 Tax=Marixanthomonas spongiae TaxID=2174845 RepID=A0A2U0I2D7_9FLAO|nr:hypothetical protein [Marixanthomonas spongiae]PVW15263.1 hypothetical protein DDV96_07615 [Marixanthomonas spongiae]
MDNKVKYILQVLGWLLLGMGIVLVALEILAMNGIIQLHIDFFRLNLDSETERVNWLIGWTIAIIAGLVLLYLTKERKTK